MSTIKIPLEIVQRIASFLEKKDVKAYSSCSKSVRSLLRPHLFSSLTLDPDDDAANCTSIYKLTAIVAGNPRIAKYIRTYTRSLEVCRIEDVESLHEALRTIWFQNLQYLKLEYIQHQLFCQIGHFLLLMPSIEIIDISAVNAYYEDDDETELLDLDLHLKPMEPGVFSLKFLRKFVYNTYSKSLVYNKDIILQNAIVRGLSSCKNLRSVRLFVSDYTAKLIGILLETARISELFLDFYPVDVVSTNIISSAISKSQDLTSLCIHSSCDRSIPGFPSILHALSPNKFRKLHLQTVELSLGPPILLDESTIRVLDGLELKSLQFKMGIHLVVEDFKLFCELLTENRFLEKLSLSELIPWTHLVDFVLALTANQSLKELSFSIANLGAWHMSALEDVRCQSLQNLSICCYHIIPVGSLTTFILQQPSLQTVSIEGCCDDEDGDECSGKCEVFLQKMVDLTYSVCTSKSSLVYKLELDISATKEFLSVLINRILQNNEVEIKLMDSLGGYCALRIIRPPRRDFQVVIDADLTADELAKILEVERTHE
ncbi:hypothetical protein HK098_003756 [Nowakowskiella sp. JEL0407]|nr:hypothetical protein HK098_003756 [Nowakowskiella sp. JEL0407]